ANTCCSCADRSLNKGTWAMTSSYTGTTPFSRGPPIARGKPLQHTGAIYYSRGQAYCTLSRMLAATHRDSAAIRRCWILVRRDRYWARAYLESIHWSGLVLAQAAVSSRQRGSPPPPAPPLPA